MCIYPHTIIRNKLLCYTESQKKIHDIKQSSTEKENWVLQGYHITNKIT